MQIADIDGDLEDRIMNNNYKYESSMVCRRCGKRFNWYCINLSLLPRTGEVVGVSIPDGSHMAVNSYDLDGFPIFKGYCTHCNSINQLSKAATYEIPEEIYKIF